MNDFENLARDLARLGYHVHLRYSIFGWHCDLHNSVISAVPCGNGAVALEAIQAADRARVEMEGDKRYRKVA